MTAVFFFDSSAIVKRYVNETGTGWVTNLVRPVTRNRVYLARITGVEVVSAITRQARSGMLAQGVVPAVDVFGPHDAAHVALQDRRQRVDRSLRSHRRQHHQVVAAGSVVEGDPGPPG